MPEVQRKGIHPGEMMGSEMANVASCPGTWNYLSLFSGVAGLDLGVGLAFPRARVVGYIERDVYAASCLVARMEDAGLDRAPIFDDVRAFDARAWRGLVDGVVAGWPCPPVSVAGKRKGAEDDRWMWPEIVRILRETDARWFLGENVGGLLSINHGREFGEVLRDLAGLGFDADWCTLRASDVGAPHERARVFILAHARSGSGRPHQPGPRQERRGVAGRNGEDVAHAIDRGLDQRPDCAERAQAGRSTARESESCGSELADSEGDHGRRRERREEKGAGPEGLGRRGSSGGRRGVGDPDEPGREGRSLRGSGCPDELPPWPPSPSDLDSWERVLKSHPHLAPAVEPGFRGFTHGISLVVDESRADQLRCLGNAVVPLCAAAAFRILAGRMED